MKKNILLIIVMLLISNFSYSQIKVSLSLANPKVVNGLFKLDVVATIPAGQMWKVGTCSIRIDFHPSTGCVTVHPDLLVDSALPCLNGGNYATMTTTSLSGGTAISLNITRLTGPCCTLSTGTYVLGRIRFNRLDTNCIICDTIRNTSVLFDSLTQMAYSDGVNCSSPPCWTRTNFPCVPVTGITRENSNIPSEFKLYDNYPNPFNPTTTIRYDIPKTGNVKITIYDVPGRAVEILLNEKKPAGSYETHWYGTNFSSGVYFYKMETEGFSETKKMLLLK